MTMIQAVVDKLYEAVERETATAHTKDDKPMRAFHEGVAEGLLQAIDKVERLIIDSKVTEGANA